MSLLEEVNAFQKGTRDLNFEVNPLFKKDKCFQKWEMNLEVMIHFYGAHYAFDRDEGTHFLSECKRHARENVKNLKSDVLILVHPFYVYLSPALSTIIEERPELLPDLKVYTQRLLDVLERKSDYSVLLLESPFFYPYTSELVEQGRFDQVLFTRLSRGELIQPGQLTSLKGKNLYLGGCYNFCCVGNALTQMEDTLKGTKIYGVPELTLNYPSSEIQSLFSQKIFRSIKDNEGYPKNKKLDDLMKLRNSPHPQS